MSLFNGNDMIVLFEEMKENLLKISDIVWYKDQFAGTMMNCIIYGIVDNENISASYLLPSGKIDLSGIVVEYGSFA